MYRYFLFVFALAQVAQLVEQWTENPRVGGSNPPLGTIFLYCKLLSVATQVKANRKCAQYVGILSITVTQL